MTGLLSRITLFSMVIALGGCASLGGPDILTVHQFLTAHPDGGDRLVIVRGRIGTTIDDDTFALTGDGEAVNVFHPGIPLPQLSRPHATVVVVGAAMLMTRGAGIYAMSIHPEPWLEH